MNPQPEVLHALVSDLSRRPEVKRIILFGSRARGDAAERADIDLAIEAPDADARQWLSIAGFIEDAPTLLDIDLVRLDEASPALRDRIAQEGKVLYDRSADKSKSY